jgi:hypothetical protein
MHGSRGQRGVGCDDRRLEGQRPRQVDDRACQVGGEDAVQEDEVVVGEPGDVQVDVCAPAPGCRRVPCRVQSAEVHSPERESVQDRR